MAGSAGREAVTATAETIGTVGSTRAFGTAGTAGIVVAAASGFDLSNVVEIACGTVAAAFNGDGE
jgi:hypothetical protein